MTRQHKDDELNEVTGGTGLLTNVDGNTGSVPDDSSEEIGPNRPPAGGGASDPEAEGGSSGGTQGMAG